MWALGWPWGVHLSRYIPSQGSHKMNLPSWGPQEEGRDVLLPLPPRCPLGFPLLCVVRWWVPLVCFLWRRGDSAVIFLSWAVWGICSVFHFGAQSWEKCSFLGNPKPPLLEPPSPSCADPLVGSKKDGSCGLVLERVVWAAVLRTVITYSGSQSWLLEWPSNFKSYHLVIC